jgi:cytochrome P450
MNDGAIWTECIEGEGQPCSTPEVCTPVYNREFPVWNGFVRLLSNLMRGWAGKSGSDRMSTSANDVALKDLLEAISQRNGNVAKLWQSFVVRLNPHLADRRAATAGTIEVGSKELVMEVFRNSHHDYSVKGYGDRVAQSFGQIYLCLDDGPEYARQSKVANEVIQSITTKESFNLALEASLAAIASLPSPNKFHIADLGEITEKVLADICRVWFGLPDEISVVRGNWRLDATPPARCPGDWVLPGNYMIRPDPDDDTIRLGQAQGQLLRKAVNDFVARRRAKPPGSTISGALFREFPNPADDDFLARTIVGIMIGFLPTVQFNLLSVVSSWWEVELFRKLQHEWQNARERDPYLRACEVLEKPLKQTMQKQPVPPAVWRTAIKPHKLDGQNVNVGDRIWINIAKATREDLSNGVTDVFAVFGGDRHAQHHPTHACPGYRAAMGVLLGSIAGLMEAN